MMNRGYRAVAMGASAGGLAAATAILSCLPAGYPLPILLVQHLHPTDAGAFAQHLDRKVALTVKEACDKEAIEPGQVHVAPANYHLLVEQTETLALSVDEAVNHSRPSIDVLFESAAYVWGPSLIGVILTGATSDGAAGMRVINDRGGLAIAQEPDTAEDPAMPRAAIEAAQIHKVLSPAGIGELLRKQGCAGRAQVCEPGAGEKGECP